MGRESRPELTGPPELYYNEDEAAKYTSNTRVLEIQAKLTYRAVELLALPPGALRCRPRAELRGETGPASGTPSPERR